MFIFPTSKVHHFQEVGVVEEVEAEAAVMEDEVAIVDHPIVGEVEVQVHMEGRNHMVDPNLRAVAQEKALLRNTGKKLLLLELGLI